jgi:hypothetical protein
MMGWVKNQFISIDQGINAFLGPLLNLAAGDKAFGSPDETLSSVFGKQVRKGNCKWCYYLCKMLHVLDPGHCKKSIEEDEGPGK